MMNRVILVVLLCAAVLAVPVKKNVVPGMHELQRSISNLHKHAVTSLAQLASFQQHERKQNQLSTTAKCTQVMNLLPNCQTLGDLTKNASNLHSGCPGSCMNSVRSILSGITDADQTCIDTFGDENNINNLTANMKFLAFMCTTVSGELCGDAFLDLNACSNDPYKNSMSMCQGNANCMWPSDNNNNNQDDNNNNNNNNGPQCQPKENTHFFDTLCSPCIRQLYAQFADMLGGGGNDVNLGYNVTIDFLSQLVCSKSSDQKAYCFQVVDEYPLLFTGTVAGAVSQDDTNTICGNVTISSCIATYTEYVVAVLQYAAVSGWQACLASVDGTAKQKYIACASVQNLGADLLSAAVVGRYLAAQCVKNSTGYRCFASDSQNPNDPFVSCLNDLSLGVCSSGCSSGNVTQFILQSGCCGGALLDYATGIVNLTFPRFTGNDTISPNDLPYLGGVSVSYITTCLDLTTDEINAPAFSSCNVSGGGGGGGGSGSGSAGGPTGSTVTISVSMSFNINFDALSAALGGDFSSIALGLTTDLSLITGISKKAFRNFKFFAKGTYQSTSVRRALLEEASALGTSFQVVASTSAASSVTSTISNSASGGANFQSTLTAVQSSGCTNCVTGNTLSPTSVSASTGGAALPIIATLLVVFVTLILIL